MYLKCHHFMTDTANLVFKENLLHYNYFNILDYFRLNGSIKYHHELTNPVIKKRMNIVIGKYYFNTIRRRGIYSICKNKYEIDFTIPFYGLFVLYLF